VSFDQKVTVKTKRIRRVAPKKAVGRMALFSKVFSACPPRLGGAVEAALGAARRQADF
jgi:hypothetical protein